jgi:S1-C subfamily serine protease
VEDKATLQAFSDALAALVSDAARYVVRVEARGRLAASGVVWSEDGTIVTAHHVIERDEQITVGLADGRAVEATLVGRDPSTDIAVLRTEAAVLNMEDGGTAVAPRAPAEGVRVGHLALALGRPGEGIQATMGVISALGGSWRTPGGGDIERYVQPDIVMYPGFSGGPLIDSSGRVIGVNSSALVRGLNITVPADTVERVVAALLEHGYIRRGWLGVRSQTAPLPEAIAGEVGQESGLLVISVEPGSPAEEGGLLMGDTIIALGGQEITGVDDLLAALTPERVGVATAIRVLRGGEVREFDITIGERGDGEEWGRRPAGSFRRRHAYRGGGHARRPGARP